MTLTVQLPDAVERHLRARATAEGTPVEELAALLIASIAEAPAPGRTTANRLSDSIDHAYHADCEADRTPDVSLETVRAAMSRIPGTLTADFRAERDER